jgi:hypothetical protein
VVFHLLTVNTFSWLKQILVMQAVWTYGGSTPQSEIDCLKATPIVVTGGDVEFNDEWWSDTGSTKDCSAASPIVVTDPEVKIGLDFHLSYRFAKAGDINMDGVVNFYDMIAALQTIAGKSDHARTLRKVIDEAKEPGFKKG